MTLSGYLQDLSQLTGDCLLEFTDENTEPSSTSCQLELTTSTLAAMMLLNETVAPVGEAHEAVDKAASTISIFTDTNSKAQEQNLLISRWNPTTTSSTTSTIPTFDTDAQARQDRAKIARITICPQNPLPVTSSTSPLTAITNLSNGTKRLDANSIFGQNGSLKMNPAATVYQPLPSAPTLETRNTETVIADLKRPLHGPASFPSKLRQGSVSTNSANNENRGEEPRASHTDRDHASDEEDYEDDEDDKEENRSASKPQKVSERKRRLNVIADSYLQDKIQKDIKKGTKAKVNNEEQSARWLVNESENRQIISSPRDYQVELFERAKEKNVIAVLDTGESQGIL
jgi:endoribonuclease Dicer